MLSSCSPEYRMENGKWAYVYYDEGAGKNVEYLNADNATFRIFDDYYAGDKSGIFYKGYKIYSADPGSFEVISSGGYSKDKNLVYYESEIVIGADPKSFKVLTFPYSKDLKTVYCGTIPMKVSRPEEFKVTVSSDTQITESIDGFIHRNPEYSYLDPAKYKRVIYGRGKGETGTENFKDFKKIN